MPDIEKEGDKWQIIFKPQPITLKHEVILQFPHSKEEGFVVELENSGKEVRFIDSTVGRNRSLSSGAEIAKPSGWESLIA